MTLDWESVAAIIGAVTGSNVLTELVKNKGTKSTTDADAAATLIHSVLDWQKTLTDRIVALEKAMVDKDLRMSEKDTKIEELQNRISHLESEMVRMENTKLCSQSS